MKNPVRLEDPTANQIYQLYLITHGPKCEQTRFNPHNQMQHMLFIFSEINSERKKKHIRFGVSLHSIPLEVPARSNIVTNIPIRMKYIPMYEPSGI